jgi:leucyl-tRNA synthetase
MSSLREQSNQETEFFDKVFLAELKRVIKNTEKSYENLVIRDVVKDAFFKMNTIREEYRLSCGGQGMRRDLVKLYIRA